MARKAKKAGLRVRIPRPTVRCGRTVLRGTAHGCGSGFTAAEAINAAVAEAQMVAHAAGQTWIAMQVCPFQCPCKSGTVNIPPKGRNVRMTASKLMSKKVRMAAPKLLSTNTIFMRPAPSRPGVILPPRIVRVCVVVLWEAIVECKGLK